MPNLISVGDGGVLDRIAVTVRRSINRTTARARAELGLLTFRCTSYPRRTTIEALPATGAQRRLPVVALSEMRSSTLVDEAAIRADGRG
ncbi:MAG: hypothetical protein KY462_09725 [Actinobacteria bacterium]|nr:hypothetical protein [Actinomycetota bacterium]